MVADFAGDHIANHDALCVSFDEDDVEYYHGDRDVLDKGML